MTATRYFEDLAVGARFVSRSRTITETDVVNYCALSGNWFELHADIEYAKKTPYGQRLVQGALIYTIALGLAYRDPDYLGKALVNYGLDSMRFPKPTFINDTIHVVTIVDELSDHSRGGLVKARFEVINQREEICCAFLQRVVIARHPGEAT